MNHVGIIVSSGGASFGYGLKILASCGYSLKASVITDRPCKAEAMCEQMNIPFMRISESSREEFSALAADWLLKKQGAHWVELFFSRIIHSHLYDSAPCINFHPSLLPSFPGMGAIQRAMKSNARFIGATAHMTDESVDGGRILAQIASPVPPLASVEEMERVSFAQKVHLFLVIFEMAINNEFGGSQALKTLAPHPSRTLANPSIRDRNIAACFENFIASEGIPWIR